jgi:hypothetical protein
MPGPKPSLTKAKAKEILNRLLADQSLAVACAETGVGLSSYYRHIDRYPDILEPIKKALESQKNTRKELAIQTIVEAFKVDWKAAAWWLERNHPSEFAKRLPAHDSTPQEIIIRSELGPRPRFAMDLTDDPEAKN